MVQCAGKGEKQRLSAVRFETHLALCRVRHSRVTSPLNKQPSLSCPECGEESTRTLCDDCGHVWQHGAEQKRDSSTARAGTRRGTVDQVQDTQVGVAALHASSSAAKAQQMVDQADRLITGAEELLTDSEKKLGAAIAKRNSPEKCPPPGRRD